MFQILFWTGMEILTGMALANDSLFANNIFSKNNFADFCGYIWTH